MDTQTAYQVTQTNTGWKCTCGKEVTSASTMLQVEMDIHQAAHWNEED